MRNYSLFLIAALNIPVTGLLAQTYCTPPPFLSGPYTGITNVTLGSLNYSSADTDGVSDYTSLTAPVLQKGQTYSMTVTTSHNLIGFFSGNLNTVAWIDWNQDGDFLDSDEKVYNVYDKFKGTYTESFTVPATALTGVTRMRVYDDMPAYEGHEEPHPCGYAVYPSNGLGQHGEVEDYKVNISSATGIQDNNGFFTGHSVVTDDNGKIHVYFQEELNHSVQINLFDAGGRLVVSKISSSETEVVIDGSSLPSSTICFLTIQYGDIIQNHKLFIKSR